MFNVDVTTATELTRRAFLADLGRGSAAIAVLSIVGCGQALSSAASGSSVGSSRPSGATASSGPSDPGSASADPSPVASQGASSGAGAAWTRVELGFVSAYILVRGGEAVVVDTGVAGSDDEIKAALADIGLAWSDVGHVILTHKHGDHAGSLVPVLTAATAATGYAGAEDLPAIVAPRPLTAVADGAMVAGLRIIATPGHTKGHISVLDETNGILVAGDALGTVGGTLAGSNPQFTEDAAAAKATVIKLGDLHFETLLVGHGDPIEGGASAQVKALGRG
jgi:glyoxylase-like metal-dependent hydrolase (beta-lactamase superfamily II)